MEQIKKDIEYLIGKQTSKSLKLGPLLKFATIKHRNDSREQYQKSLPSLALWYR